MEHSGKRLASEWQNYCVYSGQYLPGSAMNDEHVIPKSLGGFRSTVIRASIKLNSLFAHTIDARIADDPNIIFGRRAAGTRGHSGRPPLPRLRNARMWKEGQNINEGETRYTVEIQPDGSARAWDRRTRSYLPQSIFRDTGFIIPDWRIDHVARLKFTVKSLLGVGWKLFGPALFDAVDVEMMRALLKADFATDIGAKYDALSYTDPFLATPQSGDEPAMQAIEKALILENISTILIREIDDSLEWSVACVGYVVGSIRTRMTKTLIGGDVKQGGAIRLEIRQTGLRPVLLDPFE